VLRAHSALQDKGVERPRQGASITRMNKVWVAGTVVLILVIGGVLFFYNSSQNSTSTSKYNFVQEYKTAINIFSCRVTARTESNCELFVSDASGNSSKDLGIDIDYGDFSKKIQASPDGKNLLIVLEHEAIVLNTATLAQKVILQAPAGEALGTYDAFPSFIPYAKWLSDTQIQISLFKQDTPEPYQNEPAAVPLETRTISID
jgi:hypothetical protein